MLFNLHITPTNGIGILLTLIGGVSPFPSLLLCILASLLLLFLFSVAFPNFTPETDDDKIGMVRLRRVPREE